MKKLLAATLISCFTIVLLAEPPQRLFFTVDLQKQGNRSLEDNQGGGRPGTELKDLPIGKKAFAKIEFNIGKKLIQLGSQLLTDLPELVEGIDVGKQAKKLHFLHATCYGGGPKVTWRSSIATPKETID